MIPSVSQIPIQLLASGDRLSIQLYKFIGQHPGKKAYLQANLHGAEISGNAAIHQLIEFLMTLDPSQLAGEIWLVPVCNPLATNQRSHHFSSGRYSAYDGKDWNRIFWDYEKEQEGDEISDFAKSQLHLSPPEIRHNYLTLIQQRFHQLLDEIKSPAGVPFTDRYRYILQSLCLDANYVIDCHSSTNQGLDYLYCFDARQDSAKSFLLDYALLMNEYDGDAFDEAFLKPWLALEKQLALLGKNFTFDVESWTLELGAGMQMNPESVAKGVRGIKNYLSQKGMLDIPGFPLPETQDFSVEFTPKDCVQKYYAPLGGMIQWRIPLGTRVKIGDRLYQLLTFDKSDRFPKLIDVCAQTDGFIFDLSTNHSVNEADYVLSMFSQ